MACIGSRLMEGHKPSINEPNVVQDEGNATHWLIEQSHKGLFDTSELVDRKAPNGIYITDYMAEHAEDYLKKIGRSGHIEYETSFHGQNWEILSRADNIEYFVSIGTLVVDDFKYGWSIVEVVKNWTLIAHAIGYCLKHQIAPQRIVFRIHQPRPYHPEGRMRVWQIDYQQLLGFYNDINQKLSNPTNELNTGSHCYKCPNIATCPAARMAALNGIDASALAFEEAIDNDRLSYEIDHAKAALKALELRKDALEELALDRIKNGQIVNNYAAEKELTNKVWKDGVNADYLKAMTGQDLRKSDLITPNQAKKRGVDEAIIDTLTTRHEKGTKLVRIDANKKAQKLFKKENA